MTRVDGKNPGGGWKKPDPASAGAGTASSKKSSGWGVAGPASMGPGRHIVRRLLAEWVGASISYNILSYELGSSPGISLAIAWAVWIAFEVLCVAKFGTTPIKWALGLAVRGRDGGTLTWEQIIKRFVIKATPASIATASVLIAGDYDVFVDGGIPQVLFAGAVALQAVLVMWMVRDEHGFGSHDHVSNSQIHRIR